MLLYLAGGNDGLNVIVPNGAADYASYTTARPPIGVRRARPRRMQFPETRRRRIGSHSAARRGRGGARVLRRHGLQDRRRRSWRAALRLHRHDRRRLRLRHALRRRHRRRGFRPRGHADGRRQADQPRPLRQLGHGSPRPTTSTSRRAGSAAGSTATVRHEPAAGDLDRHRARSRSTPRPTPVRDPVAADGRAHDRLERTTAAPTGSTSIRSEQPRRGCPPRRTTPTSCARTRRTGSRIRRINARQGQRRPLRHAEPVLSERWDAVDPPADRRAPARGQPRHPRYHDPLGRLRHAHGPVAGQDRQLAELSRALARLPRRPARRAASSRTSARSCSPSSAGACARTAGDDGRHRPRRGRAHDGDGLGRPRRLRRRLAGL